ncbi:MAG: hypothetical protein AAFQ21_11700 [Pseudomonadota bacterium]
MKRILLAATALMLAPLASATEIDVGFSDSFAEKLTDELGEREGDYLAEEITEDLIRELEAAGQSPARIDVTILKATPNRPTFKQLSDEPGLDFGRSFGVGGMRMAATAFDAEGNELGALEWGWFENDIRLAQGSITWTDASRASQRFARKFVREVDG